MRKISESRVTENSKSCWLCVVASALLLSILSACQQQTPPPPPPVVEPIIINEDLETIFNGEQVWEAGAFSLTAAVEKTLTLQSAINAFLANPNEENLAIARQSWQQSHRALNRFALFFQFADVSPGLFKELSLQAFQLDAWPLQPGFIDSINEYPNSGLVNDIAFVISASDLREQHGGYDDLNVCLGLHAIEFLLVGEDGSRPASDYLPTTSLTGEQQADGLTLPDLANNRRRTLLKLIADLLVDDLQALRSQWQEPQHPWRQNFYQLGASSQDQLIRQAAQSLFFQLSTPTDEGFHNADLRERLTPTVELLSQLLEESAPDNPIRQQLAALQQNLATNTAVALSETLDKLAQEMLTPEE